MRLWTGLSLVICALLAMAFFWLVNRPNYYIRTNWIGSALAVDSSNSHEVAVLNPQVIGDL